LKSCEILNATSNPLCDATEGLDKEIAYIILATSELNDSYYGNLKHRIYFLLYSKGNNTYLAEKEKYPTANPSL